MNPSEPIWKAWESGHGKWIHQEAGRLSDDEVKVANTGSHVFLKATVVLTDAIEDVNLTINV
mgnify:CR=1 FL=1